MTDPPLLPETIVSLISLCLIIILTVPAWKNCYLCCCCPIASSRRENYDKDKVYEDEDGIATKDSQDEYFDFYQRLFLPFACTIGFIFSTFGTYFTGYNSGYWSAGFECFDSRCMIAQILIVPPIWLLILTQASVLFSVKSTVQKFNLGVYGCLSCIIHLIDLVVQTPGWYHFDRNRHSSRLLEYQVVIIQIIFTLLAGLLFILIPRRPQVFLDGHVVDGQYSTTLFNRLTFSWASPILHFAAANRNLDYKDLPVVSHDLRAQTLRDEYEAAGGSEQLFWKNIFWAHKSAFLSQWSLSIIQSFAQFFPQIGLYYTLRALEARDAGSDQKIKLWLLAIALGLSDAIFTFIESWLFYFCYLKLSVPIYEQIATVVFAKAIRKKDVKGVSDEKTSEGDDSSNKSFNMKKSSSNGEDEDDEDDDGDPTKSKQSTINLIGVDGKRVADYGAYNCWVLGSSIKLVIAIAFLVKLVGWIPMLSGFVAFALLMPINFFVASRYKRYQDVLMKLRDQKMAVVSEALQGIRQVKFSALEKNWYDKIQTVRGKELETQWRVFLFDTALISVWIVGPIALSSISLAVYALINKGLSASVAFTTISIFEAIEVALAVLPELITDFVDAQVSSRRIQKYLDSPDQDDQIKPGETIIFEKATVAWPANQEAIEEEQFKLRNLTLTFPQGELSVISGRTGSGKSLLLSSIIGEADILEGDITAPKPPPLEERFDHKANKSNWYIKSATAYVAQIPWIENATIKDNILFGLPLDDSRYDQVLQACALKKDLEILEDGDLTDIGANGINLSGGQKWRVSFARALYSRAGILVLDDIFSAVDAHVGKQLFEEALTGELGRGRTRILVTHHVALCLPRTKYSVLLDNGTIAQAGLTQELRQNGLLNHILAYDIEEQKRDEQEADKNVAVTVDDGGSLQRMFSNRSNRSQQRITSEDVDGNVTIAASQQAIRERQPPKKFTEEESRETGATKFSIYRAYIKAGGGFTYWTVILLVFAVNATIFLGRSLWLSIWSRAYDTESTPRVQLLQQPGHLYHRFNERLNEVEIDRSLYYYVGIYVLISLGPWVIGTIKYFCIYVASIKASKKLFDDLAYAILRAPLRFLDTTPLGRILNRFTADFNMIDSRISSDFGFMLHSGITAFSVIVAGAFVSPIMLLFAALLLAICLYYALRYLAGAREIKRLESNAKSPVFEQFGSVLAGIGTIRAFGKADAYVQRIYSKINTHSQAYYHLWLFNRWMSLRVSFVGALFLTAIAALIVGIPNVDAPLAGFALSFSLQLSECIIWMLRQYSNVELDMNAIERIVEYSNIPIEDQGGLDAPAAWPAKGELEVDNLVVSYAPELPPVLRGLSFSVKQNERVGVVGRTGAGKSSLTLALFRFLEATSGSIHIDGIDISKIKLYDLRSRLAIIPQDPVLFSGTVRTNLDAFDEHNDPELRDALTRVHLTSSTSAPPSGVATPVLPSSAASSSSINANIFKSLDSKISEGGLNLSQGQRQLLCLARAIVSRPKIMVLDEATSSVDMETDALIQRSIREEFADSTLIVIAHRLSTIADFDRILVLGEGKVLEFDSPTALMRKAGGVFRSMVEESGERRELESIIGSS